MKNYSFSPFLLGGGEKEKAFYFDREQDIAHRNHMLDTLVLPCMIAINMAAYLQIMAPVQSCTMDQV